MHQHGQQAWRHAAKLPALRKGKQAAPAFGLFRRIGPCGGIEQREALNLPRCAARNLKRHIAAHRKPRDGQWPIQPGQRRFRHGGDAVMPRQAGHDHAAGSAENFDLVAPKPGIAEQAGQQQQGFIVIHGLGLAVCRSHGPDQPRARQRKSLILAPLRRIGTALAVRRAGSAGPGMRAPPGLGLSRTHRQALIARA